MQKEKEVITKSVYFISTVSSTDYIYIAMSETTCEAGKVSDM